MKPIAYKPGHYLAFVLSDASKAELKKKFPAKFAKVICHHVTISFKLSQQILDEIAAKISDDPKVKVVGYVSDDLAECFIVEIDGISKRHDDGTYHVTHSISSSVKPVYSNILISRAKQVKPLSIEITGEIKLVSN